MFVESVPALQVIVPIISEIGLLLLLVAVLALDLIKRPERTRAVGIVAGLGMIVVMVISLVIGLQTVNNPEYSGEVLGGMLRHDMLSVMFSTMILLAGSLTSLIAVDSPKVGDQGEFFAILIAATMGMSLMSGANDLTMLFIALETASISLYILAGFLRDDRRSTEAGIKYYLFGAVTSAIMLYGLSLLYGFTGETNFTRLAVPLAEMFNGEIQATFGVVVALLLLVVGFGFKIAAVPFHFWTPDVYQGAPTPMTAFVSTASKAASFALLVRVSVAILPAESMAFWGGLMAAIAVVTMTLGNLVAIVQKDIKRMLAYSSIAQAGYTLIGVVALTQTDMGVAAIAFYMLMYILTNIGAFTVIIIVSNASGSDNISDFAGLSRRSMPLTIAMILALLSLGGVPPLAGFFGKFFLFVAAVEAGYVWLVVIAVLNSIVALYYYLTVVKVMFVDEVADTKPLVVTPALSSVLWVAGVGVLLMGTVAAPWWSWAVDAANSLAAVLP